ncbi:hypothetical protein SKUN_00111 [Spiroplasma kunkelii CR2-3x]|uniref:Lipoprotein n=1 Tax=Spiroplasma kunkelii CR2-3x TaxID=273035 RepID=A0A0K2JEM2_SPIKU|nr:hypothetical protein [Spiroplasma kunkelii]ALA97035.1 hypothetical protein SKUN_00111 [Spiroplasma kunkelii CR2-3x]
MKKLLSLLSSMILVSVTAFGTAACSTKEKNNQHKNENGDSIWAWIPGIFGGKKITSPDIWSVLENPFVDAGNGKWTNDPTQWDGSTRIKMSVQLIQILSVAILANPDKFFVSKETTIGDIADYKNLKEILKTQWQLLITNTNNTVEKKKQSFKDSEKKNWEKKYHDFLDSNYKDISGASGNKKYEIEEQNYKAAIMTTGADGGISATQMLTNVLLNNNMRIYRQNNTESAVIILRDFASFLKNGNKAGDWNTDNQNLRTQLALAFSWNEDEKEFIDNLSNLTISEINARINTIATDLGTFNYKITEYLSNRPPVATPIFKNSSKTSVGTPELSETYDVEQLSLFQKYIIEKWFQNEKPLAISKITYAFKSGATPTNTGFTADSFDETTKTQINKDLGTLSSAKSWEDFITNSEGTVTPSSDLLTLSTQADAVKSNILKSSVYNSINAPGETAPGDINGAVSKINRKNPTDPISAAWKIGTTNDIVISFFDTNALNLVHIDGKEYLKDADPTSYDAYDSNWQFKSLNYSSNFFNSLTDKSKIMTVDKAKQKMNTQFSNAQYLWYLVNRSLVNSNNNSKLKFNVLNEVKKYATLSSGYGSTDDKTWWFWIYDFFNNFNNKILTNGAGPQEWLKNFLTFKDSEKHEKNHDWFISIINAMSTNLSGGTVQRLYSSFEAENKTIEGYKMGGPAAKIDPKTIVEKINNAKVWHEKIGLNYTKSTVLAEIPLWVYKFPPVITEPIKYFYKIGGKR